MPVVHGARIQTRGDGQAEIEFENGSAVRLAPNSLLNVDELSLSSNGDRTSLLSLQEGTAYFDIENQHHDIFQISAGRQTFLPLKSAHFRLNAGDVALNLAVFKGDVQVTGSSIAETRIKKGETLTLNNNDPSHFELVKKIEAEPFDKWDANRRAYRSYYASANSYGNRHTPHYGMADLNFYGGFLDVPGYGSCWRPSYVPMGWDPFSDGAWVFYPGLGWTFASAYPWGWMPYHYGSWTWASGAGYCWLPSNRLTNWAAIPAVGYGAYGSTRHPFPPIRPPVAGRTGTTTVMVGAGPTTGTGGPGHRPLLSLDQALVHHSPRDLGVEAGVMTNGGHALVPLRQQCMNGNSSAAVSRASAPMSAPRMQPGGMSSSQSSNMGARPTPMPSSRSESRGQNPR
ncbi:MAG TPA: FecR family protein [Terriglobales bacterium]